MGTSAIFPRAPRRAGMYESFFLRAVAPDRPLGVWIRETVHKAPGQQPRGSVWCTVFDARREHPFMCRTTSDRLTVPRDGWIAVGEHGEAAQSATPGDAGDAGAVMGAERAAGSCGAASWSLRFGSREPELRHLPREWLYRAPLPRTKLTSPAPAARFDGTLRLVGTEAIELNGWRGMVGHNWGSEHAARWIWLHGVGFQEEPDAWLDVALGRIEIAGRMTPWIANGALSIGGRRLRVGGLNVRRLKVSESAGACTLQLPGERGLLIDAAVEVPAGTAAGWHYADPTPGPGHDVLNCSIASLRLSITLPGEIQDMTLFTPHGCAYELGMREHDHGVPISPFAEGG